MFRHVVLFRFAEGTTDDQVQAIVDGLTGLPGAIPEIRAYHFGPDAKVNPDNHHDFVVVADFDSPEDYVVYRDHPAHRKVIVEAITPAIAERHAIQYDLD